jgi:pimeloyl-ACP methyl ester carboxylesterase
MKKIVFILISGLLWGCSVIRVPHDFVYKEIKTDTFVLASWQKITNPNAKYKIYIEGDGYAYDAWGRATNNPTPRGTLIRKIAFSDNNENVVYLGRPCQYVKDDVCIKKYWTTARFSEEVIEAEYDAIKQIAGSNEIILVGFSGGAQVAGLVAVYEHGLNVRKIITIAGNLDHVSWVGYHDLSPLDESLNLFDYYDDFIKISQMHYVGGKDDVVPSFLVKDFIKGRADIIEVEGASHNDGWDSIVKQIVNE